MESSTLLLATTTAQVHIQLKKKKYNFGQVINSVNKPATRYVACIVLRPPASATASGAYALLLSCECDEWHGRLKSGALMCVTNLGLCGEVESGEPQKIIKGS